MTEGLPVTDEPATRFAGAAERLDLDPAEIEVVMDERIPAVIDGLPAVIDRIMEVIRGRGCGASDAFEIELAVTEALANAVKHGCGCDPTKLVEVVVACDHQQGLVIVVRDPGPGFDPTRVPSPLAGRNLYSFNGRGVFLINRLMDEVHYQRGGSEVWMRKRPHE